MKYWQRKKGKTPMTSTSNRPNLVDTAQHQTTFPIVVTLLWTIPIPNEQPRPKSMSAIRTPDHYTNSNLPNSQSNSPFAIKPLPAVPPSYSKQPPQHPHLTSPLAHSAEAEAQDKDTPHPSEPTYQSHPAASTADSAVNATGGHGAKTPALYVGTSAVLFPTAESAL